MFEYSRSMDGMDYIDSHERTDCPKCGYGHFKIRLSDGMDSCWAACGRCYYTTGHVGGIQNLIEDRLRAVIKVETKKGD